MADASGQVHFVGSIGLPTVDDVFSTCGPLLGGRLKRLTDGEVGGRRLWVSWQLPVLRSMPFIRNIDPKAGTFSRMGLVEDFPKDEIAFGELGYAREARASYQDFVAARDRGEIAKGTRFMVAIPTPYAVIHWFVPGDKDGVIEEAYTQAMIAEAAALCRQIPHEDLAIQWDVCLEMLHYDGSSPHWPFPAGIDRQGIVDRLERISRDIPDDVELGYHLCYGDMDAVHFFQPQDGGAMVDLANAISSAVTRPIGWIHMPVPIERDDDAFFAPFDQLKLHPETELYLGLVHLPDGVDGIRRRSAAARKHVKDFGIATECGIARIRKPSMVRQIITLHEQGAEAIA